MQLRSGLAVEKKACDFRRNATKRRSSTTAGDGKEPHLPFTGCGKHLEHLEQSTGAFAFDMPTDQTYTRTIDGSRILERSVSLSAYNDQSVTLVFAGGGYEIRVEELRKKQRQTRFYSVTTIRSHLRVKQVMVVMVRN